MNKEIIIMSKYREHIFSWWHKKKKKSIGNDDDDKNLEINTILFNDGKLLKRDVSIRDTTWMLFNGNA